MDNTPSRSFRRLTPCYRGAFGGRDLVVDTAPSRGVRDTIPIVADETLDESSWIGLISQSLHLTEALRFCADARAGAIDLFLGCTRAQQRGDGVPLVALDYEAFPELAERQLRELVKQARSQFPIIRCVVLHRLGRVPLAEPSVVIVVATPHRAESFAACRWLIDMLKREVAIWKREVWSDGVGSWVDPG